jgi:hypothetical protein
LGLNRDECGEKIEHQMDFIIVPIRIVLVLILIEILDIIGWVIIRFFFSYLNIFYCLENGASTNPCSETYAGPQQDSEPETISLQKFIIRSSTNWDAYLTFHSYGQYWIYPWGFALYMPDDYIELVKLIIFFFRKTKIIFNFIEK